jgi:hypothetical protein
MSNFETKSKIWKKISDNIKETYGINLFKVHIFSDGSGCIWSLNNSYTEQTQVFSFDDVEDIFTKFLVL